MAVQTDELAVFRLVSHEALHEDVLRVQAVQARGHAQRKYLAGTDFRWTAVHAPQADVRPALIEALAPLGDFLGARVLVAHHHEALAFRGCVIVAHVVHDHALGIEARDQRLHGMLRFPDPPVRIAVAVARVVKRNHLLFEDIEQFLAFLAVAVDAVVLRSVRGDRPAVLAVVALAPPAVEHAQVDDAVDAGLFARGAARLHGIFRRVQPHVHAADELARQRQIVALEQDDLALEFRTARVLVNDLDQMLCRQVVRMRLAGDDQQHAAFGVVEQARQAHRIGEQQRGALVGGEAARETDCENVGILRHEVLRVAFDQRLARAVAPVLQDHPAFYFREHFRLQRLAQTPETVVGNVVNVLPEFIVEQLVAPAAAEAHVEEVRPFARQERRHVHAVGDMAHRIFFRRYLRPDVGGHARGHLAVNARHAVTEARTTQRERGLVEPALAARTRSEPQKVVHVDAKLLHEIGEISAHHVMIEDIVSGRHRGVGREDGVGGHELEGAVEIQALDDVFAAAFQQHERGVSFVDVPHRRF